MLSTGLSVSRLVNVQVSLTAPVITAPAINALLVLGSSNVIGSAERMRAYNSISAVGADFPTSSPEWLAADMWFTQAPSPSVVYIGRWFKTPAAGQLVGRPLSNTEQQIGTWNAVLAGGFSVTVDAQPIIHVTGLTFAAAGNLNGVAAAITGNASLTGKVTCLWDQTNNRFTFTSATTGITSAVSFLTPPTAGPTDISAMLGATAADAGHGAFSAPGVATETALAALQAIDLLFSTQFYGVVCPEGVTADHLALAAFCEATASGVPHYYGVTTSDPLTLNATDVGPSGSLAAQLAALAYNHTAVQYSTTNPYAIASYLARILTTNWHGSNTTIDLMYKKEPGVAPENISATQADTLNTKNCNVFTGYANGATIIQYGEFTSGISTDVIIGADAMAVHVQAALFNVMYQSLTKVPQTDAGMSLLFTAATGICNIYNQNGFLGDGLWTAQGFGTLAAGDRVPGFYIYAPSILTQSAADRAARKAPIIQIAAKTAGSIRSADVQIYVNQ